MTLMSQEYLYVMNFVPSWIALFCFVVSLTLFTLFGSLFAQVYYQSRKLGTIPSPDGHLWLWGRAALPPDAPDILRGWAKEYGEVFKLRIGWYNWVVINSPEAFKEIFDKQVS